MNKIRVNTNESIRSAGDRIWFVSKENKNDDIKLIEIHKT